MTSPSTLGERWWPPAYPAQTSAETAGPYSPIEVEKVEERPVLPTSIDGVRDSNVPAAGGRTIVVCLDGTGDKFDGDNSNVVYFVSCLKKDDPSQVTYYQTGIGTYNGQGLSGGLSAAVDMAVGSGLGVHIKDAYRFLMQTYREGDRICLFGFSRGAYTVRCLAGMLHKVGLLPAHNISQVQFAYEIYKDDSELGWEMSADFKKTFCMNVNVHFVGVWDCVASVGFIPRKLPLSSTSTSWVQHFRHAMSLDERRAKFKICQWQQQNLDSEADMLDRTPGARMKAKTDHFKQRTQQTMHRTHGMMQETQHMISSHAHFGSGKKGVEESKPKPEKSEKEKEKEKKAKKKKPKKRGKVVEQHHRATDALEVWFAGCHADVGGGAELNEVRHKLARIPLRWMIRQCFECNTGIIFDTSALAETGLDVHNLWPVYKPPVKPKVGPPPQLVEKYFENSLPPIHRRSTALGFTKQEQVTNLETEDLLAEQVEDYFDSRANINDQLKQARGWWILEFWPVKLRAEKTPGKWEKFIGLNKGQHRVVREVEPKMHWTVERRMQEMGYKVRNKWGTYATWQVAV